jgi:hypothetical protein
LEKIRKQVFLLQESGLASPQRCSPRLIVSFTSFPDRISEVFAVAYSLLTQSLKPDAVILWLAEEEFPHKEKDLPQELLHLQSYGLSIQWCENLLSYKKLVPALRQYPEDIIVTADDDIYYPPDWLEPLYAAYLTDPTSIQTHVAGVIEEKEAEDIPQWTRFWHWYDSKKDKPLSHAHFQFGGFGALYPPNSLHPDVLRSDIFLKECPLDDDIWFWFMAVRNGTRIRCLAARNFCGWLPYCKEIDPARSLDIGNRPRLSERRIAADLTPLIRRYPEIRGIVSKDCSCKRHGSRLAK